MAGARWKPNVTVAAVIEQQNIATTGIASNIEIAAEETIAASRNIEIVSRFAAETGDAATFVADSADRLAEQSVHLDREVAQFLGRIRTA